MSAIARINIGGDRPIRPCDLCGLEDDHPRHMVATPDGEGEQIRHLDCCAAAGCPSGTCADQVAGTEGLSGVDLLAHILEEAS